MGRVNDKCITVKQFMGLLLLHLRLLFGSDPVQLLTREDVFSIKAGCNVNKL